MILDGKLVSNKIKEELKDYIQENNLEYGIAVIQVGDDPASNVYIKNIYITFVSKNNINI